MGGGDLRRNARQRQGCADYGHSLDADRPAQVELKQSFVALWRYRLLANSWQPFRRTGQNAIIKLNGGYAIASSSRS